MSKKGNGKNGRFGRHGFRRKPRDEEPEEKRRPLLADRFLARKFPEHERVLHPRTIDQLKASVRMARRFVLDEAAVNRIGEIVTTIPELLMREHQFARAPYDLTWIEFPSHVLWEHFRARNPEAYAAIGKFGDPEEADHTIGYLIDHERVNVIVGGTVAEPDTTPKIMPLQYRLHTEWHDADQAEFRRLSGMKKDWHINAYLWGSTYDDLPPETRADLSGRNSVEFPPFNPLHHNFHRFNGDGEWIDAVRGSVGEMRNIIAILLVMNRPSITRYVKSNDLTKGFHKGKLMAFMSHTTVTIDLSAVPTLRLIGTPAGESVPKRRHEVKGHYCHDETARDYARIAGCIHEFEHAHGPEDDWAPWPDAPIGMPGEPGVPRNWVCATCGGRRWWVKDHERGTAEVGFVHHDGYNVTAT